MDQVLILDPKDLELLLVAESERLLGCIMELNHAPRYRNRLNAIVLLNAVVEMRRITDGRARGGDRDEMTGHPAPSAVLPGSSGSQGRLGSSAG